MKKLLRHPTLWAVLAMWLLDMLASALGLDQELAQTRFSAHWFGAQALMLASLALLEIALLIEKKALVARQYDEVKVPKLAKWIYGEKGVEMIEEDKRQAPIWVIKALIWIVPAYFLINLIVSIVS